MAWNKPPRYFVNGRSKDKEYKIWYAMKQRCRYVKSKSYANYGGRGIDYCPQWEDYNCFIHDMGKRPTDKHQLDRLNNNLGYFKENCRWVLHSSNQANKRRVSSSFGAYRRGNRFRSIIGIEGIIYHLGTFDTKEEAQREYFKIFKEWYGFLPQTEMI